MSATPPLKGLYELRPASLAARPGARAAGGSSDFGALLKSAGSASAPAPKPAGDVRNADTPVRAREARPDSPADPPKGETAAAATASPDAATSPNGSPNAAAGAQAAPGAAPDTGAQASAGGNGEGAPVAGPPAQAGASIPLPQTPGEPVPAAAAAQTAQTTEAAGTANGVVTDAQQTATAAPGAQAVPASSAAAPQAAVAANAAGAVAIPKGMTQVTEPAPAVAKELTPGRAPRTAAPHEPGVKAAPATPQRPEVGDLAREMAAQIRRENALPQPVHAAAAPIAEERPAPQPARVARPGAEPQTAGHAEQESRGDAAAAAGEAPQTGTKQDAGARDPRGSAAAFAAAAEEPDAAPAAARPAAGQAPLQAVPETRDIGEAAAPGEAKEPAAAGASTTAHRIFEQVVKQISVKQLGDGSSQATLRLHPESLGRVEIRLELQGGHLKAHITAASDEVRDALKQYLPELQKALAQGRGALQGLSVDVDRHMDGRAQQGTFQKAQVRKPRTQGSVRGAAPRATDVRPQRRDGLDLYV